MKPSNRTTTIQNRFITYIPIWWAKAASLCSILFFLAACEEDLPKLGFKSGQDKFKVYYAEIPVTSSVLIMDSLRTANVSGEASSRLLAGYYDDPVFGATQAQALMQFKPVNILTATTSSSVFDSAIFQMRFDFYCYGNSGSTSQTYSINEITQELDLDSDYFFNSSVTTSTNQIGTATINVNSAFFKEEYAKTTADTVITLKTKLSNGFGQRLFDTIDPEDVYYTDFELFKANFKGLAIVPQQADKIVGFKPADANSYLILYYHEGSTQKSLIFVFSQGVTFSKITTDRSSTELSGLNQYNTDFDPGPMRYLQSGTSIVTKMDFSKFYEYMDTIPEAIINSAEVEISGINSSSDLLPPKELSILMLRSNNRFKTLSNAKDSTDFIAFKNKLNLSDQLKFFVSNDDGSAFSLPYSETDNKYSGFPTLFFQQLFKLKSTDKYPYWALRPSNPAPGKSVDRLVFPKDNLKLKVYYTRSILDK